MRSLRTTLAIALAALLATGCQSVFFGYVNRDSTPPVASVTYDPGRGLALDVYRPRHAIHAMPVVVFFYGGAWQRGNRARYGFVGSQLAQRGVVAIVADYRTWPTAGFPDFIDDAARAVRWSRDHVAEHGGDPDRIFIAGHSAGAQIAALLGTDARHLGRVDMTPRDLAGVIGLAGPYDFAIGGKLERIFGPPEQWPDAMAVRFVDGDEPPFLLIHGDRDRTVEPGNSRRLHAALREAGASSRIVWLAGASHFAPAAAFYSPERFPKVLLAVSSFVGADASTAPPEPE
ncbi:alpha/beta hydrolase [Luteimonas aestuarii]|uniref:Alpha/beta hydrolase n=1 Tax=Luteimonas aestuarii TaxID=453837 RepID=A0A4R5TRY3_9GAMM|nr:alpha/beta hydrolase [Luteimonas aestuarii]TDK21736.1 alpha/beta hydrolase [Luteimonas aestuarii]